MLAYHGDQAVKDKYLSRVRIHREADQLVRGQYWEGGKGCAVGCTIHGSDHSKYETELGIPRQLAHLEDQIFERLPNDLAMAWPERFLFAIRPGADLSMVWPKWALWMLTSDAGVWPIVREEERWGVRDAVRGVADLYSQWIETGIKPDFSAASTAAWAASDASTAAWAESAAASAARAAARAASDASTAAWAASDAAWAASDASTAAWAASDASTAAWAESAAASDAAWAAAWAESAAASDAAWAAAWAESAAASDARAAARAASDASAAAWAASDASDKWWLVCSDKLIDLMAAC